MPFVRRALIKLHGEAARIAHRFGRLLAARNRGKAHQDRRRLVRIVGLREYFRTGVSRDGLVSDLSVGLKESERTRTARMHHPFGDALAIEVRHLLEKVIVLQRRRASLTHRTQIAVVAHGMLAPANARCKSSRSERVPM